MNVHRSSHRQQTIIRWAIRISAVVLVMFVAVGAGIIPLQNARIVALQDANQRRADEAKSLTGVLTSAQSQYAALFAACQKSSECLAKAPSPTLVAGPAGTNGRDATDAQIYAQVQTFCTTTGFCVGQKGDTGANGADSTTPGPQGQAGADSTVPGPPGQTGATGAAGADGRGIASTICDDSGEWQVTYTDGTTQDAGSCRMSLINP